MADADHSGGTGLMRHSIRHYWQESPQDRDIAWAIQLFRSRRQLQWCLPHLRKHYPLSRVILITDGDDEAYEDLALEYACELVVGSHLMTLATCHLYVSRLLSCLLAGGESYLFRIDPDTRVWRRLSWVPAFTAMFGTLETMSEHRGDEIGVPANIQGGCIGITRDAVEDILDSGALNAESCVRNHRQTWARCADMLAVASAGRFCDDFVLSWAAHHRSIPIVESAEIRSRWRRVVANADLRYAVTHPHKLPPDEAAHVRLPTRAAGGVR